MNNLAKRLHRCMEQFPDRERFCREKGSTSGAMYACLLGDIGRQVSANLKLKDGLISGTTTYKNLDQSLSELIDRAIQTTYPDIFEDVNDFDRRASYDEVQEMFACALRLAELWEFA